MAKVIRYDTPASLRDVPEGSPFYDDWHRYVNDAVSQFKDAPWVDPVQVDASVVTGRTLSWIGFPRATMTVTRRGERARGFAEAEEAESPAEVNPRRRWRPRQFEYFEWHTTRDWTGKVTKVTFSTETPRYFQLLAEVDQDRVVVL